MSIFAKLREGVSTASAAETQALAQEFGAALPENATIALHGNLGVGKTTFVQGLARGLRIEQAVTSPTFNIFTLHRGNGRTLVHLDAYRLETDRQLDALMLDDFLTPPYWLAVEWPEKIASWLPADALHVTLSIESAGRHRVHLSKG
jgi:tRNA threonylcarbamoyladenosine biosynthesis protein TsaE